MHERDKPGSGIVGKNKFFDPERKTPHMVGHVFAHRDLKAGERIDLSMWEFKTRPGEGYTIQAKDPRSLSQEVGMQQRVVTIQTALPPDDIPF